MHLNTIADSSVCSGPEKSILNRGFSKSWRALGKITPVLFGVVCCWVLAVAWDNREQLIWTPEQGLGYALGIIGGVMMLTLLLYPLRKHTGLLGRNIPVKYWFKLHMAFGAIGPVLIVLHSNYNLGSINGKIAMFSMLAVAFSGIVGRYIYTRIHRGLQGRRVSLKELQDDTAHSNRMMSTFYELSPGAKSQIGRLEKQVVSRPSSLLLTPLHWFYSRLRITFLYPLLYWRMVAAVQREEKEGSVVDGFSSNLKKNLRRELGIHKSILIRILEFQFYERLFSVWRHLHLPLFILLVVTGFFHVYAVHVY